MDGISKEALFLRGRYTPAPRGRICGAALFAPQGIRADWTLSTTPIVMRRRGVGAVGVYLRA